MPTEYKVIYCKWSEINPDPRPYKPSNPKLLPENVSIAVSVPVEYVYDTNGQETILTVQGYAYVIGVLEQSLQPAKTGVLTDDFGLDLNSIPDEDFE